MLKLHDWTINYWPGGWVRATDELGSMVALQYRPVGEGANLRLRLYTTLMTSVEPITARRWREFPLTEIESMFTLMQLTSPEQITELTAPPDSEPLSMDEVMRFFEETPALKFGAIFPTGKVIDDEVVPRMVFTPVTRPADGRITDDFLANVAAMYNWLVARGGDAPVASISKGSDVPVGTVHRWVAMARKRGFLPPAVKGRAG